MGALGLTAALLAAGALAMFEPWRQNEPAEDSRVARNGIGGEEATASPGRVMPEPDEHPRSAGMDGLSHPAPAPLADVVSQPPAPRPDSAPAAGDTHGREERSAGAATPDATDEIPTTSGADTLPEVSAPADADNRGNLKAGGGVAPPAGTDLKHREAKTRATRPTGTSPEKKRTGKRRNHGKGTHGPAATAEADREKKSSAGRGKADADPAGDSSKARDKADNQAPETSSHAKEPASLSRIRRLEGDKPGDDADHTPPSGEKKSTIRDRIKKIEKTEP